MEPVHPHINKDITDVLFNTANFKFSRKLGVSVNFQMNKNKKAPYQAFPIFLGIHRIGHMVESLRLVKSRAEISLLKKCTSITAQGFIKVHHNVLIFMQISRNNDWMT